MFEQLAGAIADLQMPTEPAATVEAIRLHDRLGARVSVAIGELDARWSQLRPGEPPLAIWLRRQARLSYTDAERLVLTARRLREWPLTRRAWLDGVLSSSQVGAVVTNVPATPPTPDRSPATRVPVGASGTAYAADVSERHPLLVALEPVAAALGADLVEGRALDDLDAGDVPLRWDGQLVGGLRLPGVHGTLERMIAAVESELGGGLASLSREAKQEAVRRLDRRGAFQLRRAVEEVADALGVSRFTVYNYLNAGAT